MRKKPYTAIGIVRVPCVRCGQKSKYQWQICSDGNQFRGICKKCDIELNKTVLKFLRFKNWKKMIESYKNRQQ